MDLCERLSDSLRTSGMTQKELAERACVTQSAMSHYIKGDRVPNSVTLANIATALNTTSDYLLGLDTSDSIDFPKIHGLLARNANKLTSDEKTKLINALFGEGGG